MRVPSLPPSLEPLESRIAPATFTVTSTADSGAGTLRQAILDGNATAGADTVAFNLTGTGISSIAVTSPLPAITEALIIDGSTQPGFTGTPLIELSGAGAGANAHGLVFQSNNGGVYGLVINRFAGTGIVLDGDANFVQDCRIGSNATFTADAPNGTGIRILAGATGNLIGGTATLAGNAITGNIGAGIAIFETTGGNPIVGNRFFNNGGLSIDIFNDGVTQNGGAPHAPFPVLTDAVAQPSGATIRGAIFGAPSSQYQVYFYSLRSSAADATGHGEGQDVLGSGVVNTDANGTGLWLFNFPVTLVADALITATAVDAAGNTSEFASNLKPISIKIATDGRTATYPDVDGDLVTVRVNKGRLDAADFQFGLAAPSGVNLQRIDFSDDGAEFVGADLTVTAKRAPGGDGLVNVGHIDASGINLGNVRIGGDLGRIDAGDGTGPLALRSLTALSMGRMGFFNQATDSLLSSVSGNAGTIAVTTDIDFASWSITGNLASLTIGRNLVGGFADAPGFITVGGTIAKARIGGSILGGEVNNSGVIFASCIKDITVVGSIVGGSAATSGGISVGDDGIVRITVGDRIAGNPSETDADTNGFVVSDGPITTLSVTGNLMGGASKHSGYVQGDGLGSVTIGGSLRGAGGELSGSLYSTGTTKSLWVKGSLLGDDGVRSGAFISTGNVTGISIGGSLDGGAGANGGSIEVTGTIASVRVTGSVFGSAVTGHAAYSGSILASGRVTSVDVHGDFRSALATKATIGSFKVGGDFAGFLLAEGKINPATRGEALAIGSVTVGGNLNGSILAGFDYLSSTWTNSDVFIGAVNVGGDVRAANISAGVAPGTDDLLANGDDVLAPSANALISEIASITVRGQIFGIPNAALHYGFTAQQIGRLTIAGNVIPLTTDIDRLSIGSSGNFSLREA